MKLANKTAVVTGAASGIGQAIALLFASEGATVYAFDIDEAGLKETEAKAPYGAKLTTAVVDVTQADQVRDALERVAQEAGRLDILVNNAGIGIAATVDEYSASKAGVYGLTKAMAVDHAADGIRVNCICPGTVDSPWIGKIIAGQPDPDAVRKSMEARQLLGRMGTPEEIAHAALYLAQDESAFVHGTALIIDGGLTAQ